MSLLSLLLSILLIIFCALFLEFRKLLIYQSERWKSLKCLSQSHKVVFLSDENLLGLEQNHKSFHSLAKWKLKYRLPFFFLFRSIAVRRQVLNTHTRRFDFDTSTTFWLMSTLHGTREKEEMFMPCKISTDTVYNTLKTRTKHARSIRICEHWWVKPHREICYINWALKC